MSRSKYDVWMLPPLTLCIFLIAPILAVFLAALGDNEGVWQHIADTVLPRYVTNTLILMLGVGILASTIGVLTAWIVGHYDFYGRSTLEWALLLPAAIPAYLIAYIYTDFLEFAGPVQEFLRSVFGWKNKKEYWFPEIRSMGGAIIFMSLALYPYIYILARTAFRLTPSSLYEMAQICGRSAFFSVALPLARPAIVAGISLVLMEVISDFGTVEYFALETLTLGIFNVWLGMNNLPAAAQISSIAFLFILVLLVLEFYARSRRQYSDKNALPLTANYVRGGRAFCYIGICFMPVIFGFLLPAGILGYFVMKGYSLFPYETILQVAINSLKIAFSTAFIVMTISLVTGLYVTYKGGRFMQIMAAVSASGYAFPGTILAIGVLTFAAIIDNGGAFITDFFTQTSPSHAILSGTIALVIIACSVRFQAIGYGTIMAGIKRIPPDMFNSGRVLGGSAPSVMIHVVLPLLKSSVVAGGLLVFVDVMKELPMTLLLRPFNFDTLASFVYQYAKDEMLEQAALPALLIVLVGVGPVILMNTAIGYTGFAQKNSN